MKGKLSLQFLRPYDVTEKTNLAAYRLALPLELQHVRNTFHILQLHHYVHARTHVIVYESLEVEADGLTYGKKNP